METWRFPTLSSEAIENKKVLFPLQNLREFKTTNEHLEQLAVERKLNELLEAAENTSVYC